MGFELRKYFSSSRFFSNMDAEFYLKLLKKRK